MPFSLIPFILLIIPIAEIGTFILIGGQIGFLWTLLCILLTAIIGSILLRVQGFQILNQLRSESAAGRVPGKELGHGAMILVAGVLLLTPGFITDTMGFLLFIPPVRNAIWHFLASRIKFVGPLGGDFSHGARRGSPFRGNPFDQKSSSNNTPGGVVDLDADEFRADDHEPPDDTSKQTKSASSPWLKSD